MNLDQLPFNIFDVALIAILVAGILRGRRHGMSEELLSLLKWISVLLVCTLLYEPAGKLLEQSTPFSLLTSYLMVYVVLALVILAIFALFKHNIGGKLIGSDLFGKSEYYLGMVSGLVRFSCIAFLGLAMLNARYFSAEEVRNMEAFQNDVYGSNFFPTLHTAQATVFEDSLSGPWIRDHLSFLLIRRTAPSNKQLHQQEYALPQ